MEISLQKSIQTCQLDPAALAARAASQRFLDAEQQLCPLPTGRDLTGRNVCPHSFKTKTAGCHSARERVDIENHQRPQYSQYITLDTQGIQGDLYEIQASKIQSQQRRMLGQSHYKQTGNFGVDLSGARRNTGCGRYPSRSGHDTPPTYHLTGQHSW